MSAPTDFVALSLLPWGWWREVAGCLRLCLAAGDLLEQLLVERRHNPRLIAPTLRARAAAVLTSASAAGFDTIAWSDVAYPSMLAAIADPLAVLWLRGRRTALDPRRWRSWDPARHRPLCA